MRFAHRRNRRSPTDAFWRQASDAELHCALGVERDHYTAEAIAIITAEAQRRQLPFEDVRISESTEARSDIRKDTGWFPNLTQSLWMFVVAWAVCLPLFLFAPEYGFGTTGSIVYIVALLAYVLDRTRGNWRARLCLRLPVWTHVLWVVPLTLGVFIIEMHLSGLLRLWLGSSESILRGKQKRGKQTAQATTNIHSDQIFVRTPDGSRI